MHRGLLEQRTGQVEDAQVHHALSLEYGEARARAAGHGAALLLRAARAQIGGGPAVCRGKAAAMLALHVWAGQAELLRVAAADREQGRAARLNSSLNMVRLVFVRRENECKKWGIDTWRSSISSMRQLAEEEAKRSAFIRSQLDDAKRAFSQMLEEDTAFTLANFAA